MQPQDSTHQNQFLIQAKAKDPSTFILKDEDQIYPPKIHTYNQILLSQYAIALQTIQQQGLVSAQIKLEKQKFAKYPLPLIYAYFQIFKRQNQYANCIQILLSNLDRRSAKHNYVISYNLSVLYKIIQDYKGSLFYLQLTLKEKPMFEYAIFDYVSLLVTNQRQNDAIQYLKHQIQDKSIKLSQSSYLRSLLIKFLYQFKAPQQQLFKIFNGKKIKMSVMYNLGLYYKKCEDYGKAKYTFQEIITKFQNSIKLNQKMKTIDQKLICLSKINLSEVYKRLSIESRNNDKKVYKFKEFKILKSLFMDKFELSQTYKTCIQKKLLQLHQQLGSQAHFTILLHGENQLNQVKTDCKQISNKRKKEDNQPKIHCPSRENKQNDQIRLINQYNKQYEEKRNKNDKKLKFLLMKEKQLNNFFKGLKIDPSHLFSQNSSQNVQNANTSVVKSNQNFKRVEPPQSIIKKLKKQLMDYQILQFQKQFQLKNKKYQLQLRNFNFQQALQKIIGNIQKDSNNRHKQVEQTINQAKHQKINLRRKWLQNVKQDKLKKNQLTLKPQTGTQTKRSQCLNTRSLNRIVNFKRQNVQNIKSQRKNQRSNFRIKEKVFQQTSRINREQQTINKLSTFKKQINTDKFSKNQQSQLQTSYKLKRQKCQGNALIKRMNLQNKQIKQNTIIDTQNICQIQDQFLINKVKLQTNNKQTNNKQIKQKQIKLKQNRQKQNRQKKREQRERKLKESRQKQNRQQENRQQERQQRQRKLKKIQQQEKKQKQKQLMERQQKENKQKQSKIIINSNITKIQGCQNHNINESTNNVLRIEQNSQYKTSLKDFILEKDQYIIVTENNSKVQLQKAFKKVNFQMPSSNDRLFPRQPSIKNFNSIQKKSTKKLSQNYQNSGSSKNIEKINSKHNLNVLKSHLFISSTSYLKQSLKNIQRKKNTIEEIFQSFNPKSKKNILINQKPPTSRDHSKRNSIKDSKLNKFQDIFEMNNKKKTCDQDPQISAGFQEMLDQAADLQDQQLYTQAFQILTKMYKTFKKNKQKQIILIGLAYNFQKQNLFDEAQKTYLKCCKFNNYQAFMKLGQLNIRRNRIKNGVQNLQKANCIKRFNKQIQTKLVYGYSLSEDTIEKALSLANDILKRQPESLQILIMTANILQKQGRVKQALNIAIAIDNHKQSQFIKHYIGILYLSDSNVVEAFKYFQGALQIKSNHVPSLIQIATILSELKPKEAIYILQKALEIQPDNRLALTRLGKIYECIENNPQKAMNVYRKTLETKTNYEAYMKIGDCMEQNQSYLQALMNYKQALNLKKTYQAYSKIAQMHQNKMQHKKTVDNYQLALQLLPKQSKFYQIKKNIIINMCRNLLILLDFDTIINLLQQIIEVQDLFEAYMMLGKAYIGKGQYSGALQYYQKANQLSTTQNIELLQSIAVCFDKKQQFMASKQIYQKIIQIQPENTKCINNLANIHLIIGNTNEAFNWFEIMLQKMPKNIEKRLKISDLYASVGDLSKVQYHLMLCYKQKEHDIRVLQRLVNLYKEKRQTKLATKYEKKMTLLKMSKKQHN